MNKAIGTRCEDCTLKAQPFVPAYIPAAPDFIVIGEAPGTFEVAEGEPFVGRSGQLLAAAIEEAGGDPKNIMKTNAVACWPHNNRTPTRSEVACCAGRLKRELEGCTAKNILAAGRTAQDLFGISGLGSGVLTRNADKVVMNAWHPAYVLRKPSVASEFLECVRRIVQDPLIPDMFDYPKCVWAEDALHLGHLLASCPDDAWVAFDFETNQIRWYPTLTEPANSILMLQILWKDEFAIIVDDSLLYDVPDTIPVLQHFFNRVKTVGHNVKFDAIFAQSHLDLHVKQDFDTMLAWYVLDENMPMGLKFITSLEFGMHDYEVDTILPFLKSRNDEYSKVPPKLLAEYGAMDVLVTLKLRELLEKRLREEGLYEWPFQQVIMPASNALVEVELRGLKVDIPQLEWVAGELQERMNPLIKEGQDIAENPLLNLNSPQQVAIVLFDKLGFPEGLIRKKGVNKRSTGKAVLEKLKGKHRFIDLLTEYRRVQKMRSSYAVNILKQIGKDGRVHANFLIPGTEVGRLAVRNPALQTVPRPSDYYGALIRSSFIAGEGKVLLRLDYPQAELRIFGSISNEPFLIKVYNDNRDLHTEVAIAMFGENYTKEQRVHCKMFNFSYIYGGSEYSFAQDAGLPIDVAKDFVRDYNGLMPVGLQFKKDQFKLLLEQGYVETRFGRRRRFPLLVTSNQDDARKACVHQPCAGTASDLTLLSGILLNNDGWDVVLLVHDEVIMEVDNDPVVIEQAKQAMVTAMRSYAEKFVPEVPWPLTVDDVEVKERWADPLPPP